MKKCPICDTAWIYASVGDYGSGYDSKGYKINCRCGYAWKHTDWKKTMEEVFKNWNLA